MTESLSKKFRNQGYLVVSLNEIADIYVINIMGTNNADKEFRNVVNIALKK